MDVVPIDVFVNRKVLLPPIKPLIEPLALDISVVANLLVTHFQDMGIFFVPPSHEAIILTQMVKQLRISPDIHKVVQQAARQRANAKPKRA